MKKINKGSKKSHGITLLIAMIFLLVPGCSLEELPQPFPGPEECGDTSPGGFLVVSTDVDTVIWTWGMNEYDHQKNRIAEDHSQRIIIGSE
jgi:hypothetical protein